MPPNVIPIVSVSEFVNTIRRSRGYPRWADDSVLMLREVAPNLYVGGEFAVLRGTWSGIVDLYGHAGEDYSRSIVAAETIAPRLLRWPFSDGDAIPTGLLESVVPFVMETLPLGHVLIHCQAGLSRSASVAYAVLRFAGLNHDEAATRISPRGDRAREFPRRATLASARQWAEGPGRPNRS